MPAFHSRNFAVAALFSFIAVAIFCVWTAAAMSIDSIMNDCGPYGSKAVLCGTDAQNHISVWQNFLNVIPQKTFDLFLLAFLLVLALVSCKNIRPRAPKVVRSFVIREYSLFGITDPIKRALARGIIQPQIYNQAIS